MIYLIPIVILNFINVIFICLSFLRYYLVSGNCMYYYSHKRDVRPKGVIFLTGSIVERVSTYAYVHVHYP